MILTPHLLSGAAAAVLINIVPVSTNIKYSAAAILAFAIHHILDGIPHWEYDIEENIKFGALKIFADLSFGSLLLAIFIFNLSEKSIGIIAFGAFFALMPDGLLLLSMIFDWKPYKKFHSSFHCKKEYGFRKGNASQILVILISLFVLYLILYLI